MVVEVVGGDEWKEGCCSETEAPRSSSHRRAFSRTLKPNRAKRILNSLYRNCLIHFMFKYGKVRIRACLFAINFPSDVHNSVKGPFPHKILIRTSYIHRNLLLKIKLRSLLHPLSLSFFRSGIQKSALPRSMASNDNSNRGGTAAGRRERRGNDDSPRYVPAPRIVAAPPPYVSDR